MANDHRFLRRVTRSNPIIDIVFLFWPFNFACNNHDLNSIYIAILLIEILNAVLYLKICTFCVVLISFYNKMTIKPQNDAIYDRNNLTFSHLSGRLAP